MYNRDRDGGTILYRVIQLALLVSIALNTRDFSNPIANRVIPIENRIIEVGTPEEVDNGVQVINARLCCLKPNNNNNNNNNKPPIVTAQNNNSNSNTVNVQLSSVVNQINQNLSTLQSRLDAFELDLKNNAGKEGLQGVAGADGKDGIDGKPGDNGKDAIVDYSKISIDYTKIAIDYNKIAGLVPKPKDGIDGNDGKDGNDFNLDDHLDDLVKALPPFYVRVEDPSGTYTTEQFPVHLGEGMNLILTPTNTAGGVSGGVGIQVEGTKEDGGT